MWKRMRANAKRKREQRKQSIAYELWQQRVRLNRAGTQEADWKKAEEIVKHPFKQLGFRLNRYLIWMEKTWFEPTNRLLNRAAFFDIVDRISPALEAVGVLLIPVALYFAAQNFEGKRDARELQRIQQENARDLERLQQEAIEDYIGQVSEVLLNVEGDLYSEGNERIRNVLTAATLTQLRDPNLDGERKGQIVEFLTQTNLVQVEAHQEAPFTKPLVSLDGADLSKANLQNADLRGAYLGGADLRNADLSGANLSRAYLHGANFSNADLHNINFRGAYLGDVNFHNVDLREANLNFAYAANAEFVNANLHGANIQRTFLAGANLNGANISYAFVYNAYLYGVRLTDTNFSEAVLFSNFLIATDLRNLQNISIEQVTGQNASLLCGVALPTHSTDTDPNRDCDVIPQVWIDVYGAQYTLSIRDAWRIVNQARQKQWD